MIRIRRSTRQNKYIEKSEKVTTEVLRLIPVNGSRKPEIVAEVMLGGKVNYFIGNDPKKWRTNIPTYSEEGTDVTLTAETDNRSTFAGWNGDRSSCGSNTTCNITMDANKTCNIRKYTITATANPQSGGNVSCDPNPVEYGLKSICTITTNGVTGTCGGTLEGDKYTIEPVKSDCTVEANFKADIYPHCNQDR